MFIPWTSSLIAATAPTVDVADDGTWTGTIALVNEWSADDRMLTLDDETPVDVRPLPLPVTVQYVTGPGHDGATVGLMTLDEVWRDGSRVTGRGRIDMEDPQGAALARKIRGGFLRFVSADIDKVDGRLVCIDEQGQPIEGCTPGDDDGAQVGELYTRWRIMGASLLAHPAFPEAQIQLADEQPVAATPEQGIAGYNPAWGCVRPDGAGGWQKADCDDEDAVPAGPDGDRPYDPEPAPDAMTAAAPATPGTPQPAEEDEDTPRGEPTHAGLALKAADTGRVLLIQRALDEDDPAAGLWEFPGGSIETDDGEDPEAAAFREFAEETGIQLSDTVQVVDGWRSPNGIYQGYVAILPTEHDIDINPDPDDRDVTNPDDPDGDAIETVAWWDINVLPDMPALRPEVRNTPWDLLAAATAEGGPVENAVPTGADDAMTTSRAQFMSLAASAFKHSGFCPPTDWFRDPKLQEPTKIDVTEEGRILGHLALWDVPHISYQGRKIYAPPSPTKYERFCVRPIHTTEGLVDAGVLAMDTDHASYGANGKGAVRHYESTGSIVGAVRCGEDQFGIWMTGALLPEVRRDEDQRLRLSLADYSGDWRDEGAGLDLKAALAVPAGHEGFYTPKNSGRTKEDYALVASGAVTDEHIAMARASNTARPTGRASADPCSCRAAADSGPNVPSTEATGEPSHHLAARADAAAGRMRALRVQVAGRRIGRFANWVEKAGGLPPYIKRIAKHLQEEKGFDESRAIATAVNATKRMCATGDLNFPGVQHVNVGSKAEACEAVAQWEAKRQKA